VFPFGEVILVILGPAGPRAPVGPIGPTIVLPFIPASPRGIPKINLNYLAVSGLSITSIDAVAFSEADNVLT